ncbi:MAG: hypothetical protein QNJ65_12015 [Xenococcaceae cyanobacterium MO_234.B1]|nr:hypothetical protein [Xenococcaceae cyanobacterium MO_234.B1]
MVNAIATRLSKAEIALGISSYCDRFTVIAIAFWVQIIQELK